MKKAFWGVLFVSAIAALMTGCEKAPAPDDMFSLCEKGLGMSETDVIDTYDIDGDGWTQQQTDQGVGIRGGGLVGKGAGKAGDAAQVHNPRDAQIQTAGFLRQDLAQGAEQDHGAEDNSGLQQLCHACVPPFFFRKMSL